MGLPSRFKAGIYGAVAGAAIVLVVQIIGDMAIGLPIQYFEFTLISFGITGFIIGFVVGMNHVASVFLAETNGVRTLRWRTIPVVFLGGFGLLFAALGLSSCRTLWVVDHGNWHVLISLGFFHCVCMALMGIAWIVAAITLLRKQWRFGWASASMGFLLFAAGIVIQHYMFYDVYAERPPEVVAEPTGPDAQLVLKTALSAAKLQNKNVLIYLGAPSCGPCRRLDEFFNANQSLFSDDYVVTKIDLADMKMGIAVEEQLRQGRQWGGIPWMVILDADGKELISSDAPKGNIGYPSKPEAIDYFVTMLEKTRKRMSAEQVAAIAHLLEEDAAKHRRKQ